MESTFILLIFDADQIDKGDLTWLVALKIG